MKIETYASHIHVKYPIHRFYSLEPCQQALTRNFATLSWFDAGDIVFRFEPEAWEFFLQLCDRGTAYRPICFHHN